MAGQMAPRVWDVEHGACAMLHHVQNSVAGRLAMIDSGSTAEWQPADFIKGPHLNRTLIDYLFITNADQDHMSGLQGLWDAGITTTVMHHNPTFGPDAFESVKRQSGPLTSDARRYLANLKTYVAPIDFQFNDSMGGITAQAFWNPYPAFTNTNDLSLVVYIQYGSFGILFPGDLEGPGWANLLKLQSFRDMLPKVDVLVASHHGRESGYHEDVFKYCSPRAIVMSDKAIVHDTQATTQKYRNQVIKNYPNGVFVNTTKKNRHVLTTRRDGWIQFDVRDNGDFDVITEYLG